MTKQEYYDLLCVSAFDGTFPSVSFDSNGRYVCAYRGANGAKCAVGLLIPDGRYDPLYEGYTAGGLPTGVVDEVEGIDNLRPIQEAHDDEAPFVSGQPWDPGKFIRRLAKHFSDCKLLAGELQK